MILGFWLQLRAGQLTHLASGLDHGRACSLPSHPSWKWCSARPALCLWCPHARPLRSTSRWLLIMDEKTEAWNQLQVTQFNFFRYIPRSGIVGSYDNSIFKCLRNYPTVSHSCCTMFRSYHQYTSVPISLYILTTTFSFKKKNSCHPNGHEGGYI